MTKCGCEFIKNESSSAWDEGHIKFCSLHAAAEDCLAFAQLITRARDLPPEWKAKANELISKAQGL